MENPFKGIAEHDNVALKFNTITDRRRTSKARARARANPADTSRGLSFSALKVTRVGYAHALSILVFGPIKSCGISYELERKTARFSGIT